MEHHTDVAPGEVATIRDPRETAERLEREEASRGLGGGPSRIGTADLGSHESLLAAHGHHE
jgi:hypothetical protein